MLRNLPWRRAYARYGYDGDHTGATSVDFVRRVVTPLVLKRGPADAEQQIAATPVGSPAPASRPAASAPVPTTAPASQVAEMAAPLP